MLVDLAHYLSTCGGGLTLTVTREEAKYIGTKRDLLDRLLATRTKAIVGSKKCNFISYIKVLRLATATIVQDCTHHKRQVHQIPRIDIMKYKIVRLKYIYGPYNIGGGFFILVPKKVKHFLSL